MINWIKWRWNKRNYYGIRIKKHGFQIYHRTKYWFVFRDTEYWDFSVGMWRHDRKDLDTFHVNYVTTMQALLTVTRFKYEDIEFIEILSRGKVI